MMSHISVTYPFDSAISENKRLGFSMRMGRMYSQSGYKRVKGAILVALSLAKAKAKATFEKRKVYVAIKVFKPRMNIDASNYIKAINDAASECIAINDYFFSGSYDWEIDRVNPRFFIEVSQDAQTK